MDGKPNISRVFLFSLLVCAFLQATTASASSSAPNCDCTIGERRLVAIKENASNKIICISYEVCEAGSLCNLTTRENVNHYRPIGGGQSEYAVVVGDLNGMWTNTSTCPDGDPLESETYQRWIE